MTDSLDLFASAPYSNQTTSREAAEAIAPHLNRLEQIVLDFLEQRGDYGACNHETESILGLSGNTVRPRIVRLVQLGLVEDSGERRKTPSGRDAIVWRKP